MRGARIYQPQNVTVGNFLEPRITSEDQVKIRVHYCAINSDDYNMYAGNLRAGYANYGLLHEFSGIITDVGRESREAGFSVGDPVSGTMFYPCGMCPMCRSGQPELCIDLKGNACLSEYVVLNNRKVVHLPRQLPLRQGVLFWMAACCMQCAERMQVQAGQTVLIHGAGSVGLMLLQILRQRMPRLIVVSEPLQDKRELALHLGADVVLNPYQDNLAAQTLKLTNGLGFYHVVDCSGSEAVVQSTTNLLCRGGHLMLFSNYRPGSTLSLDLAEAYWKEYTITSAYGTSGAPYIADTSFMTRLQLEELIGLEFPIDEINQAFHAYASHRYQRILINIP